MKMFFVVMTLVFTLVGNSQAQVPSTDTTTSVGDESEPKTEILASVDTESVKSSLPPIVGDIVKVPEIKDRWIMVVNENGVNYEDVAVKLEKKRVRGFFSFLTPVYKLLQKGWSTKSIPPRTICPMRLSHGENAVTVKLPGMEPKNFDFMLGTPKEKEKFECRIKDGKARCNG